MRLLKLVGVPIAMVAGATIATHLLMDSGAAPGMTIPVAHAQDEDPACADLGTPVYIAGASAVRPQIREAQRALARVGSDITIIYQGTASCDGPRILITDAFADSEATWYDYSDDIEADNPLRTCTIPFAGIKPDIGISDVLAATCEEHLGGDFGVPAHQREYEGAVQAMLFAVQQSSTENAISSAAARIVLGFGGETHQVSPWTVDAELHNRVPESGTKILMAAAIDLLSPKWKGIHHRSNPNVLDAILAATNPNAAIGLLAADFADRNRDQLKVLALQADGQSCGYLPDSSRTALDKVNVREGRYAASAPTQFIVDVDPATELPQARDGRTSHDEVGQVLDFLRMENISDEDMMIMIEANAQAGTVPLCAMKAVRVPEKAPPTAYEPEEPCHCFYESINGTPPGQDGCESCTDHGDCPSEAPVCRFGFCEER
jgi:ABC-type phosphate transport system substrate-binding protein